MQSQEEAKQFMEKAWAAAWEPTLSNLSTFYDEECEMSSFSPPKQNTYKSLEVMKAHFKEIQPLISNKAFNITNLDIVKDGSAFYATYNAEFDLRIPGQEGPMVSGGILHVLLKNGKIAVMTAYEDPTPFVKMAMGGTLPNVSG